MKIHITEQGKSELKCLGFDISNTIQKILKYVPTKDISKIDQILISDNSTKTTAGALYVPKRKKYPARIELYLKNLFAHIKHEKNFILMLDIQEIGLAHAIFHEIGHHVRATRSHGIKKTKSENFANVYAAKVLDRYILDNAQSINFCYENLIKIADKEDLDINIINNMRNGWIDHYKKAKRRSEKL